MELQARGVTMYDVIIQLVEEVENLLSQKPYVIIPKRILYKQIKDRVSSPGTLARLLYQTLRNRGYHVELDGKWIIIYPRIDNDSS